IYPVSLQLVVFAEGEELILLLEKNDDCSISCGSSVTSRHPACLLSGQMCRLIPLHWFSQHRTGGPRWSLTTVCCGKGASVQSVQNKSFSSNIFLLELWFFSQFLFLPNAAKKKKKVWK
ncbi:hypothetical protein XENOCAPTIV_019144, partial [Xenoophorus captivus]